MPAGRLPPCSTGRLFGGDVDPPGHTEGIDTDALPVTLALSTCGEGPYMLSVSATLLPLLGESCSPLDRKWPPLTGLLALPKVPMKIALPLNAPPPFTLALSNRRPPPPSIVP